VHPEPIQAPRSIPDAKILPKMIPMVPKRTQFETILGSFSVKKSDQKHMPKSISKEHEKSSTREPKREPTSITEPIIFQPFIEKMVL
jgi:hypothetical protein